MDQKPHSLSPEHERLRNQLAWSRAATPEGRHINVFMDQNNKCNLRCRMCGFADERVETLRRRDMPRELFDAIAQQIFPLANYVQLSMFTEPFMTADFGERLESMGRFGVPESHVITNGTLLTERAAAQLIDAAISTVTISIDGGTREVYEKIRVGARFDSVVANVERLKTMRDSRGRRLPRIRFNHVLSSWNVEHFSEFLAFAERIGPDEVDVRIVERMTPTTGGEWSDDAFVARVLALRPQYVAWCARTGIRDAGFLRDQAGPIDLVRSDGSRLTCRRPFDTVAIHANGDILPCMAWTRAPLGNLTQKSFAEIWNGEVANALRSEFEAKQPGIDCLFCTIKRDTTDGFDDFFYRMLAKAPPESVAPIEPRSVVGSFLRRLGLAR